MASASQKKVLDALFDDPSSVPNGAEGKAIHALLVDAGIRAPQDELAIRRIWQGHTQAKQQRRPVRSYRYAYAAAAVVCIAVALYYSPFFRQQVPATRLAKKSEVRQGFSEEYKGAVNLYVKRTENFAVDHRENKLMIAADTFNGRIDFKANAATRIVQITTPNVAFEIIGTRIALDIRPDSARLHVNEGKVKVLFAGQIGYVEAGQTWQYSDGKSSLNEGTAADTKNFEAIKANLNLPPEHQAPKTKNNQPRQVRILLNDGTEILGAIVSQDSSRVKVRSPLAQNRVLELKREDIQSISQQ